MAEEPETQNNILDAAVQHFAEHGYQGASLAKIAESAGVSKSLIFWYFETKEKLFQSLVDRFMRACREKLSRSGPAGNARAKLEQFIDVYWDFISHHQQFIRIFMNWLLQKRSEKQGKILVVRSIHLEFQNVLANYLREGMEEKVFRKDLDVPSTTIYIASVLEGVLLQLLMREVDASAMGPSFFTSFKKNLMEGLVAEGS